MKSKFVKIIIIIKNKNLKQLNFQDKSNTDEIYLINKKPLHGNVIEICQTLLAIASELHIISIRY